MPTPHTKHSTLWNNNGRAQEDYMATHTQQQWDEQQAKIDELASSLDKALEEVSRVDIWGEPHQPTIDFVNRCLELIALTRAKGV